MAATIELLRRIGAEVVAAACIIELAPLDGRAKLDLPFSALASFNRIEP